MYWCVEVSYLGACSNGIILQDSMLGSDNCSLHTEWIRGTAQVPLRLVLPFLEGSLCSARERRRNAAVVKSLRRLENLQVWEESVRCKQQCVPLLALKHEKRRSGMPWDVI